MKHPHLHRETLTCVAPPRGERGLKHDKILHLARLALVAPPRGERGLKLPVRGSLSMS